MKEFAVVVSFHVKPDSLAEFLELLMPIIDAVRLEPTFINLFLHQDPEDPTRLMAYENWADQQEFRAVQLKRDYRAVVISGTWIHVVTETGEGAGKELAPGSYWTQRGDQKHSDECVSAEACVFFRFTEARFQTYTPTDPTRR